MHKAIQVHSLGHLVFWTLELTVWGGQKLPTFPKTREKEMRIFFRAQKKCLCLEKGYLPLAHIKRHSEAFLKVFNKSFKVGTPSRCWRRSAGIHIEDLQKDGLCRTGWGAEVRRRENCILHALLVMLPRSISLNCWTSGLMQSGCS